MFVPFEILPEAKDWKVGKIYRIRATVKQISANEDGAGFEILDAYSLNPEDMRKRHFTEEGGYIKL